MKYLILFLSFNLFATVNYVPEVKNNTTYFLQETCEKETSQKCYPFNVEKDVETMLVKDVEVDDTDKPIYAAATDKKACKVYKDYINELSEKPEDDDCRLLIAYKEVSEGVIEPELCTDKTYFPVYAEKEKDVYEAYCTKLVAYQQKIVKQLVEDAALKAAKEEAKALKIAEEKAKEDAIKAAKEALKNAKGKIKNMSKDELNALIENILIVIGE